MRDKRTCVKSSGTVNQHSARASEVQPATLTLSWASQLRPSYLPNASKYLPKAKYWYRQRRVKTNDWWNKCTLEWTPNDGRIGDGGSRRSVVMGSFHDWTCRPLSWISIAPLVRDFAFEWQYQAWWERWENEKNWDGDESDEKTTEDGHLRPFCEGPSTLYSIIFALKICKQQNDQLTAKKLLTNSITYDCSNLTKRASCLYELCFHLTILEVLWVSPLFSAVYVY